MPVLEMIFKKEDCPALKAIASRRGYSVILNDALIFHTLTSPFLGDCNLYCTSIEGKYWISKKGSVQKLGLAFLKVAHPPRLKFPIVLEIQPDEQLLKVLSPMIITGKCRVKKEETEK